MKKIVDDGSFDRFMCEQANSPWANVPKMTREEAASWKLNPKNRREMRRRMLADQAALKAMADKKKPKTQTYVVKNKEEMSKLVDELLGIYEGKGK